MLYQTSNPHGGDLYGRPVRLDFSANINPLGTPEAVRRAVVDSLESLHQYPDPFCRRLVKAIAGFEEVPDDFILCGCGAAELIFSFCGAVKPRRALELSPTFAEYSAALKACGCGIWRYPLRAESRFAPDEGILRELDRGEFDVFFLCNPNNPTGVCIKPELMERMIALCREKNIRLFLDECFLDLSDAGSEASQKRHLEAHPEIFILKAFTKSYGMAGLRLGYGLCSDRALLTEMSRAVQPWNISVPAQAAGVAALGEKAFLERARQLIRTQREYLAGGLRGLGFEVYPSSVNYLLFYSKILLYDGLMEQGIQIRDCCNYHGLGKGWYRVAVKKPEENRALLRAIRSVTGKEAGIWQRT